MKKIEGGITGAKGFEAAGVAANIKYQDRKDMALVYSLKPAVCAGTFTTNVVKAAPVLWDMKVVKEQGNARLIIINSGFANACTGAAGMEICRKTAEEAAKLLDIKAEEVLIGSTGVIGVSPPLEKLLAGTALLIKEKSATLVSGNDAATAIMTTDTVKKQVAVEIMIGGKKVTIGGMSKGSGMIHPNMCTMLAYVTTDVLITKEMLTDIVNEIIADTYNMISVDGDTSTNDTFLVLANGEAGNPCITDKGDDYQIFKEALFYVNEYLAKEMARDGEGATTLIEMKVVGAANKEDARKLAKSVIGSSLVKSAVYGRDANWGRVLCALGYSGVMFDPDLAELYFGSAAGKVKIYEKGSGVAFSEEEAKKILSEKAVTIFINMNMGDESATAWGCDLTEDYVKINADYRS
ncbi:MAG: bifunctional glutamate N-acetyltransferase/amino-acid acetyltransferase ArgJ [Lachnospiraceae bacterium]|nr:bifunctional glutamate N-acetyltransferase/amino-acid acetyltransferase ArgJ [Lachnospiraceae bacterium]